MSLPEQVPSDDAAILQLSSVGDSAEEDDTEDPVSRGQSPASKRDMFVVRPPKRPRGGAKSARGTPGLSFQTTKGASLIP